MVFCSPCTKRAQEPTYFICIKPCVFTHLSPYPSLPSRWHSYKPQSAHGFPSNTKRHSEGTFTSDFTRYLDKMKAKDFVHWLINTKRYR